MRIPLGISFAWCMLPVAVFLKYKDVDKCVKHKLLFKMPFMTAFVWRWYGFESLTGIPNPPWFGERVHA